MTLADLRPGQKGIIHSLDDEDPFIARLSELGFVPGEEVQVIKKAPLGDPMEVQIMDSSMCIRTDQARQIRMETPET